MLCLQARLKRLQEEDEARTAKRRAKRQKKKAKKQMKAAENNEDASLNDINDIQNSGGATKTELADKDDGTPGEVRDRSSRVNTAIKLAADALYQEELDS